MVVKTQFVQKTCWYPSLRQDFSLSSGSKRDPRNFSPIYENTERRRHFWTEHRLIIRKQRRFIELKFPHFARLLGAFVWSTMHRLIQHGFGFLKKWGFVNKIARIIYFLLFQRRGNQWVNFRLAWGGSIITRKEKKHKHATSLNLQRGTFWEIRKKFRGVIFLPYL